MYEKALTMKNTILLLFFALYNSFSFYGQEQRYDFSKVNSRTELHELFTRVILENRDKYNEDFVKTIEKEASDNLDFESGDLHKDHNGIIREEGMHYGGVPLYSVVLSGNTVKIISDTLNYAAKEFLAVAEKKYGLAKLTRNFGDGIRFKWDIENQEAELDIVLVNGVSASDLGSDDMAYITVSYAPIYDVPLANIQKDITKFENQTNYILRVFAYGCVTDVSIDDIYMGKSVGYGTFSLNYWITKKLSMLKIVARPAPLKNGKAGKKFQEDAKIIIEIEDSNTRETLKKIKFTEISGIEPLEFKLDFDSTLPYYPKAWSKGKDLRNESDLKEKIIALYDKLGKAILSNDQKVINEILYQQHFEVQQIENDNSNQTARDNWENILTIQKKSTRYEVNKDFEIEFGANGKVVITKIKDYTDMLQFSGDNFERNLNYGRISLNMYYQPESSDDLLIVR